MRGVLVGAVTAFEMALSAIARTTCEYSPYALIKKDKQMPASLAWTHDSLEDLQQHLVAAEIDGLLRESTDGWRKFLETRIHVKLSECPVSWDSFAATVQHRHIVVHADNRVTRQYLQKRKDAESALPPLGSEIPLTQGGLRKSIDDIEMLGMWLFSRAAKHFEKRGAPRIVDTLTRLSLIHQRHKWWPTAAAYSRCIADIATDPKDVAIHKLTYWCCVKSAGRWDEVRGEFEGAGVFPNLPEVQIRHLALRGDYDAALALLGSLDPHKAVAFLMSPFCDGCQSDPSYQAALRKAAFAGTET
jgi:hypothetical protein